MHEELEHAIRKTAESYEDELASCDRLRDFVHERTLPWKGRPLEPQGSADQLVAALFSRAFTTYWAAVELVRMGFGHQAAMLNRSLFEDMVDAHWVCTEPEVARERFSDHLEHGKMLLADQIAKYPDFYPPEDLPSFAPDARKRLDDVYGRYGTGSWTGVSLHERVSAIEHHWKDDEGRGTLRFYRDIAHRENNQTLHVSAQGLSSLVRGHDASALTLKLGPGSEMLDRALFGSFWIFGQIVGLILDHFEFQVTDEERADVLSADAFVSVSPEDAQGTGRNDPCPCGNGKKFKRCHGA